MGVWMNDTGKVGYGILKPRSISMNILPPKRIVVERPLLYPTNDEDLTFN